LTLNVNQNKKLIDLRLANFHSTIFGVQAILAGKSAGYWLVTHRFEICFET
jgi:hypothetical protein